MGGVLVLILVMIVLASKKFAKENIDTAEPTGFSAVLSNKWYVDEIYEAIVVKPINWISSFLSRVVDNKLIDGLVNGVGKGVQFSARQLRLLQSGQVGSYILIMMIAIILFFIFQLFWKL
jgi:NADH-quinone oxidoreductase subunit L